MAPILMLTCKSQTTIELWPHLFVPRILQPIEAEFRRVVQAWRTVDPLATRSASGSPMSRARTVERGRATRGVSVRTASSKLQSEDLDVLYQDPPTGLRVMVAEMQTSSFRR